MIASSTLEGSLASWVGRIARVLADDGFPSEERAALRRMLPTHLPPLAFYRFALRYLPETWDAQHEMRRDWITLVAGIALMSPRAHQPQLGLGRALAVTGFSEARLERLLASEGDTRRLLLLRAVRFLTAKVQPFDWVDAAQFLLTRDGEKLETLHRRIARDYYGAANENH